MRLARDLAGGFLVCSGYLFAIRRELVQDVPQDSLAEDAVISHHIAQQGYRIRYAPDARVFVKYPDNYGDWLRQRVRSAGGYAQDYVRLSPFRMRSPRLELVKGTPRALRYARSPRELFWTLLLFGARLHLWALVLINVRLRKRSARTLWQRVESTK
jgi:cellulose synthase/poly-beta-1,6-N-acetylglucosamine synthase-like glycosyltransferase